MYWGLEGMGEWDELVERERRDIQGCDNINVVRREIGV